MSIHTGPTMVRQIAEMFRLSGNHVLCEGTENVYVLTHGSEPAAAIHNLAADCERLTNIPQSWLARAYQVVSAYADNACVECGTYISPDGECSCGANVRVECKAKSLH